MYRLWIAICLVCGVVLLTAALLVPAHSRALDAKVLEAAGKPTPGLIEEGITLVQLEKVGPARLLLQAAQTENFSAPGSDRLTAAIANFSRQHPELVAWGGADPSIEKADLPVLKTKYPEPVVDLLMQRNVREKMIEFLRARASRRPGLNNFLANRLLTNTVHFPPSSSASGQAFDGAVIITGLLYQGDHFTPPLRDTIEFLAMKANKTGEDPESLELVYLDLLSLGKRLDWVSLLELLKKVEDINTIRQLAEMARSREEQFASLFAAVQLSGQPGQVVKYLEGYSESGVGDLSYSTGKGVGAVQMLLKSQHRVFYPGNFKTKLLGYDPFGAVFYQMVPLAINNNTLAVLLKYALLFVGAWFVARLVGGAAGRQPGFGLKFGADTVLALAIAFILGLVSEPFVGLPSQIRELPIRFHVPVVGLAPGSVLHSMTTPLMNNQMSLLPLVFFFVLQTLIYIWCLAKLKEIRTEPMTPQMKLRMLENEDHLFDLGLYIGFVGTIIAMILFSLGVAKFSLMSAYSSTSFGIIFVVVLKIFHVRPLRRKLILESEAATLS